MGKMKIVWEGYPDRVIVTIEVSGIPFNPLDPTSKDNTKDDEEEVLGGMCLHLVQQMIDEFSYSRTNNNNVFRFTKFRKSRRNKVEK
jgi:anti-sigma regulatory factor (Ser/Thr protein kinase)